MAPSSRGSRVGCGAISKAAPSASQFPIPRATVAVAAAAVGLLTWRGTVPRTRLPTAVPHRGWSLPGQRQQAFVCIASSKGSCGGPTLASTPATLVTRSGPTLYASSTRSPTSSGVRAGVAAAPPSLASQRVQQQDVAAFEVILASEWLLGVVRLSTPRGVLVDVTLPGGGQQACGLVRPELIDGIEAEQLGGAFRPGHSVHVRVLGADDGAGSGALRLSMLGGAAEIQADLEAQLDVLESESALHAAGPYVQNGRGGGRVDGALLQEDQDVSAFAAVQPSQWLFGTVHHAASYGLYVEVAPPGGGPSAWGIVHLTEIGSALHVDYQGTAPLSGELAPGSEVQVRVLAADVERGTLVLSMLDGDKSRGHGGRHGGQCVPHYEGLSPSS